MADNDASLELLSEYHPMEFPPRAWHVGPSESDRDARGLAYFKVGRGGVERMTRNPATGDVYIYCRGGFAFIHCRNGWALLVPPELP